MNLSSVVIPLLLSAVAVYGLGKRVNVYAALTRGAEEGLTVLLRIVPALIGLLTAVTMFRASGAWSGCRGCSRPCWTCWASPPRRPP